ncbi:MAG: hypothetical protein HUJ98_04105 [Bacteroidaceae bacterium]|nr:hypothetical protein [Bacteroidaceae bacterium]
MALLAGSEIKVKLTMGLPSGLTPDDIDFTIVFRNGSKSFDVPKANCFKEQDVWCCIVQTAELGNGNYKVEAHYRIPDEHETHDFVREIYVNNSTHIRIGY